MKVLLILSWCLFSISCAHLKKTEPVSGVLGEKLDNSGSNSAEKIVEQERAKAVEKTERSKKAKFVEDLGKLEESKKLEKKTGAKKSQLDAFADMTLFKDSLFTAKKQVELSEKFIVVDDEKPQELKCPEGEFVFFAKFKIGKYVLDIYCMNEYMGGFYYKAAKKSYQIAQDDGDAGSIWDMHSLFFINDGGELVWWKRSYSTHENIDCADSEEELRRMGYSEEAIEFCRNSRLQCEMENKYYRHQDGDFIEIKKPLYSLPKRKLSAFEYFQKHCS